VKKLILILITLIIVSISVETCQARWRLIRRRVRNIVTMGTVPQSWYDANDQGKCEIEAKYMNDNGIRYHIWGNIGHYEGWGYGGPNCATCTPRKGMTLTGDAHVGNIRVRSWR